MGLWERVCGTEDPKIPVHAFYTMCAERARGKVTSADVYAAFALSAGEQAEFDTLVARLTRHQVVGNEVHEVLCFAEWAIPNAIAPYDSVAAVKNRLGV